jgi:hypothetical protein
MARLASKTSAMRALLDKQEPLVATLEVKGDTVDGATAACTNDEVVEIPLLITTSRSRSSSPSLSRAADACKVRSSPGRVADRQLQSDASTRSSSPAAVALQAGIRAAKNSRTSESRSKSKAFLSIS